MKTLLALILIATSSIAYAWQPGELQQNFSDIRAAQEYGRQQVEQSRMEAQQIQQQIQIQQMQDRQNQMQAEQYRRYRDSQE